MFQRYLLYSLLLSAFGVFTSRAQCAFNTDSLALYYPMNGSAIDLGPNGNHGTVMGATPTTDRHGNPNGAYFFDGTTDHIRAPSTDFSGAEVSVMVWVKPTDITSNRYYNIARQGPGPANVLLAFQEFGTVLSFGINTTSGYVELDGVIQPSNFTDGNWHCIAATFDGAFMNLYVDGVQLANSTWSGTVVHGTSPPYCIGCMNLIREYYYGSIDDLIYFRRALGPNEVMLACGGFQYTTTLELGPDTTLCRGDAYTLDASMSNGQQYQWSTGASTPSITVYQTDTYWVTSTDSCGLTLTDTVMVTFDDSIDVDLGNDTTICMGSQLELSAAYSNSDFLWQDGSTDSLYVVSSPGLYTVTIFRNTCQDSDSIYVDMEDCSDPPPPPPIPVVEFIFEMPNVFSPNGDNMNDWFTPVEARGIQGIRTKIYNRWGQLIYETTDPQIMWDGGDYPEGVYFWVVELEDVLGEHRTFDGSLHLFR